MARANGQTWSPESGQSVLPFEPPTQKKASPSSSPALAGCIAPTDDEKVYETARALRDHGRFDPEPNLHHDIGYNWRPSELHAVLGLEQLRRVEKLLERRRHIAHSYDEKLKARNIPGINLLEIPICILQIYSVLRAANRTRQA